MSISFVNKGPSIITIDNDTDAINFINNLSGNTFATIEEALEWVSNQDDITVQNRAIENLVTDELVFYFNPELKECYSGTGNTIYNYYKNDTNYVYFSGHSYIDTGIPANTIKKIEYFGSFDNSNYIYHGAGANATNNSLSFGIFENNEIIGLWGDVNNIGDGFTTDNDYYLHTLEVDGDNLYFTTNGITKTLTKSSQYDITTDSFYIGFRNYFGSNYMYGDMVYCKIYNFDDRLLKHYYVENDNVYEIVNNELISNSGNDSFTYSQTTHQSTGNIIGANFTNNRYFNFDKTGDDEYIVVGDVGISSVKTVCCWFRYDNSNRRGSLFSFGDGLSTTQEIYLWGDHATGAFGFNHWNSDSWGIYTGETLLNDDWHMVTAVFYFDDYTKNKMYIDGVEYTLSNVLGTNVQRTQSNNFGIGWNSWNSSDQSWIGDIERVYVYDRELNYNEILQNYYGGNIITNGLVFHIDAGNLVSFESGDTNAYNMTGDTVGLLQNGVSYTNKSFVFDGTNDKIVVDNTSYNFGTSSFTLSCWFRRYGDSPGDSYGGVLIAKGGYGGGEPGYAMYVSDGSDTMALQIRYDDPGGDIVFSTSSSNPVVDYQWYHLTTLRDTENQELRLYINGVLDDTTTDVTNIDISTNEYFQVGCKYVTEREFYGEIAKPSVYNRALTDEEILQNFNAHKNEFL